MCAFYEQFCIMRYNDNKINRLNYDVVLWRTLANVRTAVVSNEQNSQHGAAMIDLLGAVSRGCDSGAICGLLLRNANMR